MYCARELTRHMATPTTTDWEKMVRLGRYLKKQTQDLVVVQISRNAGANVKRTQTQIGQVAEEHVAVPQEDTQFQGLISTKCGAEHKLLWLSVHRKPNCHGLVKASAETTGLIWMYKDICTPHEWIGTGRCERSSRHCGPTRVGQIEASGHQLFVDPRESSKGVT